MAASSTKGSRSLPIRGRLVGKRKPNVCEFDDPLFPACDGQRWQNRPRLDVRLKVKRQFLEAYFRINLAYSRLVALRKKYGAKVPLAQERRMLREIERALVAREKLEDLHACRGVFATPVYRDGFAVDLRFSDGRTGRSGYAPLIVSSASVRITFPLPAANRS